MADDKKSSLKSSFDLAMERLAGREGQGKSLSDQQKKAIAEAERKAKAKVAELEIMLHSRLMQAQDDAEKIEKLKSQHQIEIARIREKAEEEKERIRQESDKGTKAEGTKSEISSQIQKNPQPQAGPPVMGKSKIQRAEVKHEYRLA